MTDRKPGVPNRWNASIDLEELQKMQAGETFHITLTRADEPITEGTPYSKEAVLPDDLAANLCPDVSDPTPADALKALYDTAQGLQDTVFSGNAEDLAGVLALAQGGTGNTTGTAEYLNPHGIASTGDLDTITTPGFYYCASSASAKTIGHSPTENAFGMIVSMHAGTFQLVVEYLTTNARKMYWRNCYNGTWGNWCQVMTDLGGLFEGYVAASTSANYSTACLRNIEVRATSVSGAQQATNRIICVRK